MKTITFLGPWGGVRVRYEHPHRFNVFFKASLMPMYPGLFTISYIYISSKIAPRNSRGSHGPFLCLSVCISLCLYVCLYVYKLICLSVHLCVFEKSFPQYFVACRIFREKKISKIIWMEDNFTFLTHISVRQLPPH